jgi:biopolymer transport protein ExbD
VTVTRSQEIYINDVPVAPEDLLDELEMRAALAPEKPLFVKSDVAAPYGMIVNLVDKAREAGVERIGLLVDREMHQGR